MIPTGLGNNFWTFAGNDSLYGTYPDRFSGTMIEFSAIKFFHDGTIKQCLVVCELLSNKYMGWKILVTIRQRFLLSIIFGIIIGIASLFMPISTVYHGAKLGDLCAPLFSMKSFLSGQPAYGVQFYNNVPVTAYPFTAMLMLYPFTFLPLTLIGPLFCTISTSIFAYALLRDNKPWKLFVLLSPPFIFSINSMQFVPLITSALLLPSLLPLSILKPQLGFALIAAGKWSYRTFLITLLTLAASLVVYPNWIIDWLKHGVHFSVYAGKIPAFQGLGCILLLSLIKWRSRSSRLLSAMALAPQRLWYDQLMLFLIPETARQLCFLLIGSWLSVFLSMANGWFMQPSEPRSWIFVICFLYFPTLCLIFQTEIITGFKKIKNIFGSRKSV
jgi:hypothetical protein